MSAGAAWPQLRTLAVGDQVPRTLYVQDYADGTRPRWTVRELEALPSGGRRLVLVDPDNGAGDLFDEGQRVAVVVLAWPTKTLRSQPHTFGSCAGNTLCDMDQQARAAAR